MVKNIPWKIFSVQLCFCLNHFKLLYHSCFESPGTLANNSGYPTIKQDIHFQNEDPSGKYLIVYTNYKLLTKKSNKYITWMTMGIIMLI